MIPTKPGFYWCLFGSMLEVVRVTGLWDELRFERVGYAGGRLLTDIKCWGPKLNPPENWKWVCPPNPDSIGAS